MCSCCLVSYIHRKIEVETEDAVEASESAAAEQQMARGQTGEMGEHDQGPTGELEEESTKFGKEEDVVTRRDGSS